MRYNIIFGKSGSGKESVYKGLLTNHPNMVCFPQTFNQNEKSEALYVQEVSDSFINTNLSKVQQWANCHNAKVYFEISNIEILNKLINAIESTS